METLKLLADILVELQASEQYEAARIVGIRLKEEIYKLSTPKEIKDEVQPVQLEQT